MIQRPSPVTPAVRRPAASSDTVSALERGLAVLGCFVPTDVPLSNADLARLTGIPRPTVTRLAATLVAGRLLRQDPQTERFRLGSGVVALAHAYLGGFDVREHARPVMDALAAQVGGSVYLAVPAGVDMVLIEVAQPPVSVLLPRLRVGARVPVATSALGRVWLAALPDAQRRDALAGLRRAHGRGWDSVEAPLQRALEHARTEGWCASDRELYPDICAFATALATPSGDLLALNCGGAATAFPPTQVRRLAPRLMAAAAEIASLTGGRVPLAPAGTGARRRVPRASRSPTQESRA